MTETFKDKYSRFFNLDEIRNDKALVWYFGYLIFSFATVFKGWSLNPGTATNILDRSGAVCWPWFQSCGDWIFLTTLPDGYTQQYVFAAMMGLMAVSVFYAMRKEWVHAHLCLLTMFVFKIYLMLIYFKYNANYDYYHTTFAFIFLFLPHKRFFLMFSIVFFYFLSTAAKIHETWILGTYFSSLQTGLPLFPDATIPVWTNLVMIMEMVFAWFLFSKNEKLRQIIFVFFFLFHLYSSILVGYHYPLIVLTPLVILFWLQYRPVEVPRDLKSTFGWFLALVLLMFQMVSHTIPGDEKLTLEGNFYGLYMFEANHQCVSNVYEMETMKAVYENSSANARHRCNPYTYMKLYQKMFCEQYPDKKFGFSFDHSINGNHFYRIVNEPDLCSLEYKPFTHNEWIRTKDKAKIVGHPVENYYR